MINFCVGKTYMSTDVSFEVGALCQIIWMHRFNATFLVHNGCRVSSCWYTHQTSTAEVGLYTCDKIFSKRKIHMRLQISVISLVTFMIHVSQLNLISYKKRSYTNHFQIYSVRGIEEEGGLFVTCVFLVCLKIYNVSKGTELYKDINVKDGCGPLNSRPKF